MGKVMVVVVGMGMVETVEIGEEKEESAVEVVGRAPLAAWGGGGGQEGGMWHGACGARRRV